MSGPRLSGLSERAIAISALIACLSLVGGLFDVALRPVQGGPIAPPPPVEQWERDAELELTVTDAASKAPIAGATARAFWERAGKYYLAGTGRSAENGGVTLHGLPRGVLWVLVEAPSHGRSSTQVVLSEKKQSAKVELAASHALAVSVLEDGDGPIAGATVLVTAGDPLPFGALTDAEGTAHFNRLGDAPWTVKASARGFESVTRSGLTSDTTLTLRRLGSLEVRVEEPSGAPARGASVAIAGSSLWPARRAETDSSGISRIAGLLSGTYELKATRGDLASDTLLGLVLERGAHEKVTLRLRPGRLVSVLVSDGEEERARGVADADVVLVESGLSSFPLRGRTGADGLVTLGPISPGPATLGARAAEFVPRGGIPVPEKLEGPVRIALRRGATLRGEVVDAKGRPVDGASVEVIGTDLDGLPLAETPVLLSFRTTHFEWALPGPLPLIPAGELGVMPGPVPPIPAAWAPLSADPLGALGAPGGVEPDIAVEPWVTGLDGRFTAHPVTPGRVRALVRHPAYVEGTSDVVALAPGGEASVRVVLLAGGSLEGRVVDERGGRVSGARVDLVAERGTLERTTLTASDGSFAFAAVPAEIVLAVARPEDPTAIVLREAISVSEGEKKIVELRLPALRESVRVRVVGEHGTPIDAAQVTLLSTDPKAPLRRTLFTGPDGSVSVADARGLALRVLVEAPGWARAAQTSSAAPETLEIVLERGISVVGRVTAVRGRRYVEGASVTLIADGLRKAALTDREGSFTLREVSPGPARLLVSHPEFANAEQTVEVRATGRADRPFELEPVDLSEPGVVEGEVVDVHGKPVSGARVALGVAPAYLPVGSLPPGMAVSDGSGRFRLSGVSPGNVEIEAYAADIGRGSTKLVVSSGRPIGGVRIRLDQRADDAEPAASGSVAVTLGERSAAGGLEIVIVNVAASSEAERAGLREGDVIESLDGVHPQNMRDARARLSGPAGSDVVIGVRRAAEELKLRVGREAVRR